MHKLIVVRSEPSGPPPVAVVKSTKLATVLKGHDVEVILDIRGDTAYVSFYKHRPRNRK